jgi:AraC-like DNA-binding protein
MKQEKLFLDEDLRSGDLAVYLKQTPHQFSEFLSEVLGTHFHELIQSYRIEEAKKLIITNREENILNIAYSVGFRSKSTFNYVFKRIVGQTPQEYRNQNKSQFSDSKDMEAKLKGLPMYQ